MFGYEVLRTYANKRKHSTVSNAFWIHFKSISKVVNHLKFEGQTPVTDCGLKLGPSGVP